MKALVSATTVAKPQFYDLDPMNIVWHGNYPRFLEIGRTALMDQIGYGYRQMVASGFAWPIIDLRIRYGQPLRLGQELHIIAGLVEWENRLRINYEIRDALTNARLTRATTIQVAVDVEQETMLWRSPDILFEKLSPYLPPSG